MSHWSFSINQPMSSCTEKIAGETLNKNQNDHTSRSQLQEFEKIVEIQGTGLSRLFYWYLTEEIEHRCVTFNIFQHLYGDYFYRLFVGCYGQYHFFQIRFSFLKLYAKTYCRTCQTSPHERTHCSDSGNQRTGRPCWFFLGEK